MKILTQEYLKEILDYNPETGIFVWKISNCNRIKIGQNAGSKHHTGYNNIIINKKIYSAHRLAWLYNYGEWPKKYLDHINGIKNDNRLINLREATNSQNQWNSRKPKNNTSGYKGVSWWERDKKWCAYVSVNNKKIFLGYFDNIENAKNAHDVGAIKYHGEFSLI